jgi:probable phosphoglycerate mutase
MKFDKLHLDLFLIRHAQPEKPANHWTSPSSPLSEKGIKQAQLTGEALKDQIFTELISSPFLRAKQTIEYIQQALEVKSTINQQPWLAEIDLGLWAGKDKNQIQQDPRYPSNFPRGSTVYQAPIVARLLITHKLFAFPGGESLPNFWDRVANGFKVFLDNYRDEKARTIGLVAHGGSFTVILSILMGKDFEDIFFPVIALQMGKYAHVRIYKGRVMILQVNK